MRDKILQGLKTKNSKYGLSQTILEVLADDLAKTVEKEEDVETAVAGVEGQMKIYQSFADQNRTLQTEITNLKKAGEGKTEEKKEEEKKKEGDEKKETGEEIPAWAKGFTESIKTLTDTVNAYKAKESAQTNAEKFSAKLKELQVSEDFLKTLPTFERSFESDEQIEAVAKEYKEKSDVFLQISANSALAGNPKPLFGEVAKEGGVSSDVQAFIKTNYSNETNTKA